MLLGFSHSWKPHSIVPVPTDLTVQGEMCDPKAVRSNLPQHLTHFTLLTFFRSTGRIGSTVLKQQKRCKCILEAGVCTGSDWHGFSLTDAGR